MGSLVAGGQLGGMGVGRAGGRGVLLTFRGGFLSWRGPASVKRASAPILNQAVRARASVSTGVKSFAIISCVDGL